MRLYYYKDGRGFGNFGDDLSPWIWKKLLPGVINDDSETLFIGIGTLLSQKMPRAKKKVVFGSGVGYGGSPPKIDNTWKIYCLRGPLSAKALGVSSELAVTDSAALVGRFFKAGSKKKYGFSYMPHVTQAYHGSNSWKAVCDTLDFGYIDPRWAIEKVLSMIDETECLITEAMHGAIVADTLRIPWIPVKTNEDILAFKWQDWCASIGTNYAPSHMFPLWDGKKQSDIFKSLRHRLKMKLVICQLAKISGEKQPNLSKKTRMETLVDRLGEKLSDLKQDIEKGLYAGENAASKCSYSRI